MENRIVSISWLFSILVLFAMLTVPSVSAYDHDQTYNANATYFVLEDIRVPEYCQDQTVEIWANVTVPIASGRVVLNYTCCCANITNVAVDKTNFEQSGDPTYGCGWANIPFLSASGHGPGKVHICDITIHCCNDTIPPDCCGTDLIFDNSGTGPAGAYVCELIDTGFTNVENINWADGTFLCGDAIEVTKTVWDDTISDWVDEITRDSSYNGTDVRFNITVKSKCLDLSNVVVSDTMDSGLLFNDTSSPPWNFALLAAGTSQSIEFNATLVGYGTSKNTATVSATVTALGVDVQAQDDATVILMAPAGIDVTKTVWDPAKGEWVKEINSTLDYVDIGDPASESGHLDMTAGDWSYIGSQSCTGPSCLPPGGYGGYDGGNADFRGLMGPPTGCGTGHEHANFTMDAGAGTATKLVLRHLDGSQDDSFDVFIVEGGQDILIGHYAFSGNTNEYWTTTTFNFAPRTGVIEFKLVATDPVGSWCSDWGQVMINWAKLLGDRAKIGETYRFRCEMHNSGSPGMDLTDIEVWDVISPSLQYANSAMIMTPDGVWRSIEPPTSITYGSYGTMVNWTIDDFLQGPLTLLPCQTFVVEYNVTVIDYGLDCNIQYATGFCAAANDVTVQGSDTACIDTPKPDLTVTDITVNYDLCSYGFNKAFGPTDHIGYLTQENKISADITELNGVDIGNSFNVTFAINGNPVCTVQLPGIAAGATETVYCDDQFRPMAGVTYTITVTVDSLSHPPGEIPETDEGNNAMAEDITARTLGYKGNHYQDGRNITTKQCHVQGTINLLYSPGDSYYLSSYYNSAWTTYEANWTPSNLPMPATDTCIKKARLYVYYNWDKTPNRNITDYFSMDFNGYTIPVDDHYSDVKWSGHYPYGMLAYDVANVFKVLDNNTATLTDSYPGGDKVSMDGMLLVVVYNHSSEPDRIIWINEGYDMLGASTTGAAYNYGVSSEEATAYANFTGCEPIPMAEVVGANLITVASGASDGGDKNRLYFNDGMWKGIWDSYPPKPHDRSGVSHLGAPQLGMNETDVRMHLEATDNTAAFQSHIPDGGTDGDGFRAANAFLIVQKGRAVIEVVDPPECIGVTEQFDVPININPMGASVYGVEYELSFNSSVIHAEWQNEGDFLKQGGANTNVYINTIDNSAGKVTFAVTRKDISTGATEPGTLATVHFTAVQMGANTTLTLTSVKASDPDALSLNMDIIDSIVYVCDNVPPVAVPECLFKYNNVGTKYMSKTYFDGSASTDDGSITNYRWYFGDGNYGAGMTYEYRYGSWNWNGASYDPFEVILTVEDDGTPMMDNSTKILVDVYIAGDSNGDGEVDIFDATIVGLEWGKETTDYWATNVRGDKADLNNDMEVDIFDAVIIGANWGHFA